MRPERAKIRGVLTSRGPDIPRYARLAAAFALLWCVILAARLLAHPAPFSYLDAHVTGDGLTGRLVMRNLDVAPELKIEPPSQLADPAFVARQSAALAALLQPRLTFFADGQPLTWSLTALRPVAGQDAVEMLWRAPGRGVTGRLTIGAHLFPYDPNHQTFINVYEGDVLVRQEILMPPRQRRLLRRPRQGLLAVFTTFTASGIHHIAIGPDHILFIIGLLLLGGSIPRLLAIVTAFTLGHSVTLALATLQIVDPPSRIIEPAIALSIVYVGADNLLTGTKGRDVRAWVALVFGLVHGFQIRERIAGNGAA